jgi:hypothetical protein
MSTPVKVKEEISIFLILKKIITTIIIGVIFIIVIITIQIERIII